MKKHLIDFYRSPAGLGTVGVCASFMVLLRALGVLSTLAALLLFPALVFSCSLLLLNTRFGAASVVGERDRERAERDARILGGVAAARKRLSLLRIEDEGVAAALRRLIHASGSYLEAAVRGADRDPVAEEALFGALESVDEYLRLADAEAQRKRRPDTKDAARPDTKDAARPEGRDAYGDYQRSLAEGTAANLHSSAELIEGRLEGTI